MAIFPKFFEDFMTHIIRSNRDKKIKLFPELSITKIFGDSFVRFISDRSLGGSVYNDVKVSIMSSRHYAFSTPYAEECESITRK